MPIVNPRNSTNKKCSSIFASKTPIAEILKKQYMLPQKSNVPAGSYISTITDILDSVTSTSQKEAIDVQYDLEDMQGNEYNIFLRYPINSSHIRILAQKLTAEGAVKNFLADAIGAVEDITIEYSSDDSIGTITSRSRHGSAAPANRRTLGGRRPSSTPHKSVVTKEMKDALLDEDDIDDVEDIDVKDETVDEDFDDFFEEDED